MNMPLAILNRRRRIGAAAAPAFSPSTLFALAEPGVWYDPSDLTTLFTDTAGTTPVTTPGNTVALMLDKSKAGVGTNGASRRNLLTFSEDLRNTASAGETRPWVWAPNTSVTANTHAAPDGTMTADTVTATSNEITQGSIPVSSGSAYSVSISIRKTTGATVFPMVSIGGGTATGQVILNTNTGVANIRSGLPGATNLNVVDQGDYWRLSYTLTPNGSPATVRVYAAASTDGTSYASGLSGSCVVWGAQVELGSTASTYQPITSSWADTIPGNHATQATAASRPTYGVVPLGGRRNLLLNTDTMSTQSVTVTAVAHTLAFTGTGTITLTGASIAGPLIGTGAGNRVSLTFTPSAGSLTMTVVGSVTLAQLELGSTATAYQRVSTAFDVTEAGVQSLSYLSFDGVDDGMVTGTITPGTNKVQVFAGVRKLSDAAAGVIVEHSTSISTQPGSFYLLGPRSSNTTYDFTSRGSLALGAAFISGYAAPTTNTLTGLGDISGDRQTLRVNRTQVAQSAVDQGTGDFLAYPLYIGRRAGTSLPFNGNIFSLIVRFGANLTAPQITDTETWVNGKTGAY